MKDLWALSTLGLNSKWESHEINQNILLQISRLFCLSFLQTEIKFIHNNLSMLFVFVYLTMLSLSRALNTFNYFCLRTDWHFCLFWYSKACIKFSCQSVVMNLFHLLFKNNSLCFSFLLSSIVKWEILHISLLELSKVNRVHCKING